jgi:predicted phage-related endonuclease
MATTAIGLSEKQQAMRESGIGASEVFDVLNGGIATYARNIGEAWTERHPGVRIYTPGTLRHPAHEWALASPDRVVAKPGLGRPARADWLSLLEIKTVFFAGGDFGEGADDVPEKYLVQVAWQQEVCDIEEATLVALVNGDYREYPIARDREMGGMLLDVVGRWWREHVLARVPPPVDGSAAYTEYLRRRHPAGSAPALPSTPELRDLIAKVREAKKATKAAEEHEALVVNQLRATLGEAEGVEGLCTYRLQKGSSYTVTREPGRVLRLAKEK